MMFNINKKFKYSNGSATILVIVSIALLLIFIPYMTKQLTNQLKSTMDLYNDEREKYLAEAGIEKSILEIEKQIKNIIKNSISTEKIENKEIEIPYYEITIDNDDNLTFYKNNLKSSKKQIVISRENGKITSIDFININDTLIGAKAYNYEIQADIYLRYIYKGTNYSIQKSINSYTKVN